MKYLKLQTVFLFLIVSFTACKKQDVSQPGGNVTVSNEHVILNPYSPLTASILLETSVATKISIRVVGKHEAESDVVKDFDEVSSAHNIPVLGLYADYDNTVELTFKDVSGLVLGSKSYSIKTSALPAATFPAITIDTKNVTLMARGMTLVSYFGYKDNPFPESPFIFDASGDIRWYLDFRTSPVLNNLFFDDGMERLQNGDLYFGDIHSNAIYEIDFLGNIIDTWTFPGYQFHHNVQEKPNGNFLVTVSKQGNSTTEDYIIEIDRSTKQIIRTWDLHASLRYSRQTLTTNPDDWIHVNAVIYDASDNTIIISGRTQALVKLDENNNVVWIMGCHKGWGNSGNGIDLNNFLLQPLNKNDQPITDQDVLDGYTNDPDFEWNWFQHAPLLMPNGNVMVFDNGGDNRNFSGAGQYSRAVEFEINTAHKTVKQIWAYGKERGAATFSGIVSDVDFLSNDNHVIFSPGAVNNITIYGKVIELDYATQNILFEATLTPPQSLYGITFHRTERLTLYL
ncbi:hypothetical protein FRZ67_04340 [Panacibacter ginsenosidivorans]|uniref:Arylsulfotransferase N-terminal domain-containing protein n=1 Tax=Panacibacter ginsenosidivorans TaxID=1813871 RepID=A0A5B8V5R2_9BACT|nr:aryl-sulfate sulfotransferase [Panacibacter ginsenosidivorans]QEC66562.1 hypothetical protein FRZ67_04340 [Panacibacter ginsenosidivorans]